MRFLLSKLHLAFLWSLAQPHQWQINQVEQHYRIHREIVLYHCRYQIQALGTDQQCCFLIIEVIFSRLVIEIFRAILISPVAGFQWVFHAVLHPLDQTRKSRTIYTLVHCEIDSLLSQNINRSRRAAPETVISEADLKRWALTSRKEGIQEIFS